MKPDTLLQKYNGEARDVRQGCVLREKYGVVHPFNKTGVNEGHLRAVAAQHLHKNKNVTVYHRGNAACTHATVTAVGQV